MALLRWFKDHLKDRRQDVVIIYIKGQKSDYVITAAGVPHGSVMGQLLFLIYINDIALDIGSIRKRFADDYSMYSYLENLDIQVEILNYDLEKVSNWAKKLDSNV